MPAETNGSRKACTGGAERTGAQVQIDQPRTGITGSGVSRRIGPLLRDSRSCRAYRRYGSNHRYVLRADAYTVLQAPKVASYWRPSCGTREGITNVQLVQQNMQSIRIMRDTACTKSTGIDRGLDCAQEYHLERVAKIECIARSINPVAPAA